MTVGKDSSGDMSISVQHAPLNEAKDKKPVGKAVSIIEQENKLFAVKENVSALGKTLMNPGEFDRLMQIVESRNMCKSAHAKWQPLLKEEIELKMQMFTEIRSTNFHQKVTDAVEKEVKVGEISHEEILEKLYLREMLNEIVEMLQQPDAEKWQMESAFFDMCGVVWSEVEKRTLNNEPVPHNLSDLKKMGEDIRDEFFGLNRDHDLDKVRVKITTFHTELSLLNQLELDPISEETIALAKEKAKKKYQLDPEMQKIYIQKFGPYVSKELKQEAAENMTNQLIAIGSGFGIKDTNLDHLSDEDVEILSLVKRYEQKKNEKIPFLAPHELKDHSIEKTVTIKSHKDKTKKKDFKVEIKQESHGHWVVNIRDKDDPKSKTVTFTSSEVGHEGYIKASAFVHAYLDKKFYEGTGLKDELTRIAEDLGITPQTLQMLGNMKDLIPRKGGGAVSTETTLISSVSDPLKAAEMIGVVGDIVGLSLIIPSILEAMKANKMRKERNELEKTIDQKERELEHHLFELRKLHKKEYRSKLTLKDYESIKELQADLKSRARNDNVIAMEQRLDAVLRIRAEVNPIVDQHKELHLAIVEKCGAVVTNILSSLAYGVRAGITLHHLVTASGTELAEAAATACSVLATLAVPVLLAGGAIQLGFDVHRMHKSVCKKDDLTETMNKLLLATNDEGNPVLSEETISLLQDINKMELRNINTKIASTSLWITTDAFMVAVGVTLAAGLGSATLGPGVIVIPVAAGTAVAGLLAYDAGVKLYTNKKQKRYMKRTPDKSDIGKIARLNLLLRHKDSKEAKLVGELLLNRYYGISPEIFVEITNGVVDKYHTLQKKVYMSDILK